MTKAEDLEREIASLSADDVAWDRQFEQDVAAGKLDALAAEALNELQTRRNKRQLSFLLRTER